MERINDMDSVSSEVTLPYFDKIRKATMGETYQYLNKLAQTKSITNLDELLQPNEELTVFDESLQLVLIESLKSEKEVFKILLSQNERQIKAVLGWKWFFQNLPADFCTQHIFPYVSLSVRCKIINRLSKHLKSTEEAEKYFTFIKDNYDNARAECILSRCSPEFILSYVESEKPTFEYNTSLKILQNICKRFPDIGVRILSTIFDKKKGEPFNYDRYKSTVQYLAGYHPDLIVPFLKKHSPVIPCNFFGRKLTKKLGRILQEDLHPDFIGHLMFKEKVLFSIVNFEYKAKVMAAIVHSYSANLSSRNWARSDDRLAALLNLVPQNKRQDLIDKAFRQVYNVNLIEYPKCWSRGVLETLPKETRLPYVEKLEQFADGGINVFRKNVGYNCFSPDDPENYVYLYDSRLAFEKLREILRKTPAVHKRQTILYQLVKSCWLNKDYEVLEEVVEYVATRHRNDDNTVISRFMEAICDHFPVSTISSTIFEKLDDLAYFCLLRSRMNIEHVYHRWMENYIYHRLDNGLDVEDHVKRYFESQFVRSYHHALVRDFRSTHSKFLIFHLCKEAANWILNHPEKELDTENDFIIRIILESLKEYNKLHKRNRILLSEVPELAQVLQKFINATYSEVGGEEWPLDIWDRYYIDAYASACWRPMCLFYVFKRRPDMIVKHLEGLLKILYSEYFREYKMFFIFLVKMVSFFGETEKLKEIILNEFQNGKSVDKRKIAFLLYSQICTMDEFSRATERYTPKQGKLERGPDEGFNEIQMLVPTMIKHVRPRHKNLQSVLTFLTGDFFKRALSSFYACCCNTRCDVVVPFLKERLENVPPKVSFVKDTIRLILILSDKNGRRQFCLECWDKHKHYSVRSTVLRFASQCFTEERTQEWYEVLEKCTLNCDELTAEALPEVSKIPEKYLSDYASALWRFSDAQKPNFRGNFRNTLLQGFTENNINFLSKEFCESIIRDHLFDKESEIAVGGFAAVYLVAEPGDIENRALVVLNLIGDRKPDAKCVYGFFNTLIGNAVEKPSKFAELFAIILKNWPEYLLDVLYEQRVLFTYHNLYQSVLKKGGDWESTFVEFGKELGTLYGSVDNLSALLPIYTDGLQQFFGRFETHKVILALKELVLASRDRVVAALAVLCMPSEAVAWYKKKRASAQQNIVSSKREMDEFVKILEGRGDTVVNIYLRSKFEFVKCPLPKDD